MIDRYAVVGYPIEHSQSPMIHKSFARLTGEKLCYDLLQAKPTCFENAVREFAASGGKGLNITLPHKEAAFKLANNLGPEAQKAKAVNTLSILSPTEIRGDNTDGIGLLRDLTENHGLRLKGKSVLILGAGGAARGIIPPLMEANIGELALANRTIERAHNLAEIFSATNKISVYSFKNLHEIQPYDVVINATSAGIKGENFDFPSNFISPDTFCYDLSYSLTQTPFVTWAYENGASNIAQGWGMLIEQAAESFWIWRGIRPDTRTLLKQTPTR
jgi:shikimate dehydrogenase